MRRLIGLSLAALAVAPATAGAGPRDNPHVRLPDFANAHLFEVTAHGVQRYDGVSVRRERPEPGPFNERGTTESSTTVRFRSRRPARVTISESHGEFRLRWHGDPHGADVPVEAAFEHRGSERSETTGYTHDQWQPVPPPDERNCSRTIDWLGFELHFTGTRLHALAGGDMIVSASDPFRGCPWGDRIVELYPARARLSLPRLFRSRRTKLVLRAREGDRTESGRITTTWSKTTTIHLTFRKVR